MFPIERRLSDDEITICKQNRDKIERFVKKKLTNMLKQCRQQCKRNNESGVSLELNNSSTIVRNNQNVIPLFSYVENLLNTTPPHQFQYYLNVLPISQHLIHLFSSNHSDAIGTTNFPADLTILVELMGNGNNQFWLESCFVEYTWIILETKLRALLSDYNKKLAQQVAEKIMQIHGPNIIEDIGRVMRISCHSPGITNKFINCRQGTVIIENLEHGVDLSCLSQVNTMSSGDVDDYNYEVNSVHEFETLVGEHLISMLVEEISFVAFVLAINLEEEKCTLRFNWH